MRQITATEFKTNFGKYLDIVKREDIVITKSGRYIVRLSGDKLDKVKEVESIFGIVPWNGEDIDIKQIKAERLARKITCISASSET